MNVSNDQLSIDHIFRQLMASKDVKCLYVTFLSQSKVFYQRPLMYLPIGIATLTISTFIFVICSLCPASAVSLSKKINTTHTTINFNFNLIRQDYLFICVCVYRVSNIFTGEKKKKQCTFRHSILQCIGTDNSSNKETKSIRFTVGLFVA